MTDISETIKAKSNQLNADDLIGTTIDALVTNVTKVSGDQPIAISYEGDAGKPYFPCKSMRRVLAHNWGVDAKTWHGKSMRLYRDADVKWAGIAVGGIRISHLSGIKGKVTMSISESRKVRKPFFIQPLETPAKPAAKAVLTNEEKAANAAKTADAIVAKINAAETKEAVVMVMEKNKDIMIRFSASYADLAKKVTDAVSAADARLSPSIEAPEDVSDGDFYDDVPGI
jgi:hypothetical protein